MKQRFSAEQFLDIALSFGALTTSVALSLYGYLGAFSRYGSDDYCLSAFFVQDHLFDALIHRYFTSSSRYTNILFIGFVDRFLGWYNVAILPALMLVLFVLGLYLFLKKIAEMFRLRWSPWLVLFLSLSIVYFSVMQAPDLYETLYWRAGMTSHFAPLVFIPFFGAFLLRQIRNAKQRSPSVWIYAACFVIPFVIGGLSEPPTALMITVLALGIVAAWWWPDPAHLTDFKRSERGDARYRRSVLLILFWSLSGAMTALVVLAVAPANALRMHTPPPPLRELIVRTFYYPSVFAVDTLRTLPLPTLLSFVLLAVFFYAKYAYPSVRLSEPARNRLVLLALLVLVFAYLFIAATFAPSVYGQSYPAPRARFAGRVLMTTALLMEGTLAGTLLAQLRVRPFSLVNLRRFAIIIFMMLALYPLRTAWRSFVEIPVYRQRAAAWDLRDSEIRRLRAEGIQDLKVRFLSKERSQDLGDYPEFRLNRCAAILYDVHSIVAVPMKK